MGIEGEIESMFLRQRCYAGRDGSGGNGAVENGEAEGGIGLRWGRGVLCLPGCVTLLWRGRKPCAGKCILDCLILVAEMLKFCFHVVLCWSLSCTVVFATIIIPEHMIPNDVQQWIKSDSEYNNNNCSGERPFYDNQTNNHNLIVLRSFRRKTNNEDLFLGIGRIRIDDTEDLTDETSVRQISSLLAPFEFFFHSKIDLTGDFLG